MKMILLLAIGIAVAAGVGTAVRAPAAATTFTVTSLADGPNNGCDADCTLREAITAANSNAGADTIEFAIADGAGQVKEIVLQSSLPTIADAVTIDGTTQAGTNCIQRLPMVRIRPSGTVSIGLTVNTATVAGNDVIVKGLAIGGFQQWGIRVLGNSGFVLECSYLGTLDGETAAANKLGGIRLDANALNSRIGGTAPGAGNLISGNFFDDDGTAIFAEGQAGLTIQGNIIGLNRGGDAALPNGNGITVRGTDSVLIGGSVEGARNVISASGIAFSGHGIRLQTVAGNRVAGVTIQGNYIGTDIAGLSDFGNEGFGITGRADPPYLIGGSAEGAGNVVSGNRGFAISPSGTVTIEGNIVGLGADGMTPVPNRLNGIYFDDGPGSVIRNNVISANGLTGMMLFALTGTSLDGTVVQGNIVGYAADGVTPRPNLGIAGITVGPFSQPGQLLIGGTGLGEGNRVLADWIGPAVWVLDSSINAGTVTIRGNSLVSEALALDLRSDDDVPPLLVTPNDPAPDADTGPNGLLNFPVLETAEAGAPGTIAGTLTSAPNQQFTIDVYHSTACGEPTRDAVTYIGSTVVQTNAAGTAPFQLSAILFAGDIVTATTTDAAGATSEISAPIVVSGNPGLPEIRAAPCTRVAGWHDFEVQVFGSGFDEALEPAVTWDGEPLDTTFVSSTELRATVTAEQLGRVRGTAILNVVNGVGPDPGFEPFTFTIHRSSSDADCNGMAGIEDAVRVMRIVAGLESQFGCPPNANKLGAVDAEDAQWILNEVAGLVDEPLLSESP